LKDITALSECKDLKHVNISDTRVSNFNVFQNFAHLETCKIVSIWVNYIEFCELSSTLKHIEICSQNLENFAYFKRL